MLKTTAMAGLTLQGLISGFWTLESTGGMSWAPLLIGLAGALPLAARCAERVFHGGKKGDRHLRVP